MNFSAIVSNLGVDFTNTSWCSRLVGMNFPGVVIPTDPTTYCNDLGLFYHYVSDIFILFNGFTTSELIREKYVNHWQYYLAVVLIQKLGSLVFSCWPACRLPITVPQGISWPVKSSILAVIGCPGWAEQRLGREPVSVWQSLVRKGGVWSWEVSLALARGSPLSEFSVTG